MTCLNIQLLTSESKFRATTNLLLHAWERGTRISSKWLLRLRLFLTICTLRVRTIFSKQHKILCPKHQASKTTTIDLSFRMFLISIFHGIAVQIRCSTSRLWTLIKRLGDQKIVRLHSKIQLVRKMLGHRLSLRNGSPCFQINRLTIVSHWHRLLKSIFNRSMRSKLVLLRIKCF